MIPLDPRIPPVASPNFLVRLYELFKEYAKAINNLITYAVTKSDDGSVVVGGDLEIQGTRITGDFTNATVSDRLLFKSDVTDGASVVSVIPNGSSNVSGFGAYTGESADESYLLVYLASSGGEVRFDSGKTGSGSYLPMTFYSGGLERKRIDTNGNDITHVETSAPTLSTNQQMVFALTSNTNLRVSVRGTDGTTRVANITLA